METTGQENADLVAHKKFQVKECGNLIAVIKMKAHPYASWVIAQLSDTKSLVDTEVPLTMDVQGSWTNLQRMEDGFGNYESWKRMWA